MIVPPYSRSHSQTRVSNASTAELLAGRSLALEVLLDHALRRDAGVVVAGLEQAVVPLHAPPPDQRVRECQLERVSEMEIAGDVRRREGDDVRLARVVGFGGV